MSHRPNRQAPCVKDSYLTALDHAYSRRSEVHSKGRDRYDEIGFGSQDGTFSKIRDGTTLEALDP